MSIEKIGNDGFIVTGEHINAYRLLSLRMALKLECSGLKSRAPVTKIIRDILTKANHTAPRNKEKLRIMFDYYLQQQGLLQL